MEGGSSGDVGLHVKGVPTHGGRYVQYNICGNLFEVSSKYVPPIRPVGRGAYGIVWYITYLFSLSVCLSLSSSLFTVRCVFFAQVLVATGMHNCIGLNISQY